MSDIKRELHADFDLNFQWLFFILMDFLLFYPHY
jgi:hypothetical protein